MPTSTYENLDPLKKQTILFACIDEFASKTFTESSINQIVKNAGIPRGSFYQYFADKEDCYLTILNVIASEKLALFKEIVENDQTDTVFEEYEKMLDRAILWIKEKPKYYQIGAKMDMDNSDFIRKLLQANQVSFDYFVNLVVRDQERGIIKKSVDPHVLVEMFFSINRQSLMKFYYKQDYQGMKKEFQKVLEILKGGACHV